ncbi:hypothetical protein PRK78_003705 [Emydomyces testavorans]|uniref:Uncharacterized protein n=1 Tax=Emydomyces testavorans TaxID=2070801 RepID=A0AAF0DIK3_9EURO|nr:hypothetical protein PRK78_003705 [Emydomyces testavorans]
MFPRVRESYVRTKHEELAANSSVQAVAGEAGRSCVGPGIEHQLIQDTISSASSLTELEDDEAEDIRHTIFKTIKIHTAKCDVCNQHNKSTLRRCIDCGWQICTPCWDARGGNGTHGVSHKFRGPVFTPEKEKPTTGSQGDARRDSDATISLPGDELDDAQLASKGRPNTKKNQKPKQRADADYVPRKGRTSQRPTTQDKGKGKTKETKTSQRNAAVRKAPGKNISTAPANRKTTALKAVPIYDDESVDADNESEDEGVGQNERTPAQQTQLEMSPNDAVNPMYWLCEVANTALETFNDEEKIKEEQHEICTHHPPGMQSVNASIKVPAASTANGLLGPSPLFVPLDALSGSMDNPITSAGSQQYIPQQPLVQHLAPSQLVFQQSQALQYPITPPNPVSRQRDSTAKRRAWDDDLTEEGAPRELLESSPWHFATNDYRWTHGYTASQRVRLSDPQWEAQRDYLGLGQDVSWESFNMAAQSSPQNNSNEETPETKPGGHFRGRPWDL